MPTSDQLSQLAAECDPGHNVRRMSSFLPGTSTLGLRGQTWANSSLNRRATEHNPVNLVFCKEKLWNVFRNFTEPKKSQTGRPTLPSARRNRIRFLCKAAGFEPWKQSRTLFRNSLGGIPSIISIRRAGSLIRRRGETQLNRMVLLETGNLKCNLDDKLGIVYQISPPQSGWLLAQPMEPLEARILYPIGGVLNPARMNIECRADSQQHF